MIKMIWAEDLNHGIAYKGKLPWDDKEEMQHFRTTTLNKNVVMGRKTLESIGMPLPKRNNIIISNSCSSIDGAKVYSDIKKLMIDYKEQDLYIIGGESIYRLFFPYADELIISTMKQEYECDHFMKFDYSDFEMVDKIEKETFFISYLKRSK